MTPEELDEALEIARNTGETAIYSRRLLARAVLELADRLNRIENQPKGAKEDE